MRHCGRAAIGSSEFSPSGDAFLPRCMAVFLTFDLHVWTFVAGVMLHFPARATGEAKHVRDVRETQSSSPRAAV